MRHSSDRALRRRLHRLAGVAARLRADQSGATALEYGLVLSIMAAVTVTCMKTFGSSIAAGFIALTAFLPDDLQ